MRLELHETQDSGAAPAGNPLKAIRVELEAESKQSGAVGLRFLLIFTNTGSGAVHVQDPDDAIQVELVDDKGWPVRLPSAAPAALINTRTAPGPHKNPPKLLTLEPGGQHRAPIQIREVETGEPVKRVPLAPGTYTARLRVLLVAADPTLERERSYRKLESQRLKIDVGP